MRCYVSDGIFGFILVSVSLAFFATSKEDAGLVGS